MIRRFLMLVMCACCIVSITSSAQSQEPAAGRVQAITLEVTIVELIGAQPEDMEKIERSNDELKRLMLESKAKVLSSLRIRTRLGDVFSARVGQSGPIQTGGMPVFQATDRRGAREPIQAPAEMVRGPQLEYQDTGLTVEGSVSMAGGSTNADSRFDIRIKIELSAFDLSTGKLTPTITRRTLTDVVRVKEGEKTMAMSLLQQEPPWSSPASGASGASLSRSSFVVLLTARPIR